MAYQARDNPRLDAIEESADYKEKGERHTDPCQQPPGVKGSLVMIVMFIHRCDLLPYSVLFYISEYSMEQALLQADSLWGFCKELPTLQRTRET